MRPIPCDVCGRELGDRATEVRLMRPMEDDAAIHESLRETCPDRLEARIICPPCGRWLEMAILQLHEAYQAV